MKEIKILASSLDRRLFHIINSVLKRVGMLWSTVQELNKEGLLEKITSYFTLIENKLYLAKNLERPFSVVLHTAGIPVSGASLCPRAVF